MKQRKILMVSEDRGAVSLALNGVLDKLGRTTVIEGHRLGEALERLRFDLVVIDDGELLHALSLIALFRKRRHRSAVLVIKDDISWEEARVLLLAGADDVIADSPRNWARSRRFASSVRACLQG